MHQKFQWHFRVACIFIIGFDEVVEDLSAFLNDKGDGPGEKVHEVGQKVGMWAFHKLLDVKRVVLYEPRSTSNFMTAPLLL